MLEIVYYILISAAFLMLILGFFNEKRVARILIHILAAGLFGALAMASFNVDVIGCGITTGDIILCSSKSFIDQSLAWIFGSLGLASMVISFVNMVTMLTNKEEE